mmetsp:Transcript_81912/g.227082  ORF Transcript_81912/g.227082 Transcript_81912/m.227082 type:complete len:218 (-) Transcript_81912:39-692(-)
MTAPSVASTSVSNKSPPATPSAQVATTTRLGVGTGAAVAQRMSTVARARQSAVSSTAALGSGQAACAITTALMAARTPHGPFLCWRRQHAVACSGENSKPCCDQEAGTGWVPKTRACAGDGGAVASLAPAPPAAMPSPPPPPSPAPMSKYSDTAASTSPPAISMYCAASASGRPVIAASCSAAMVPPSSCLVPTEALCSPARPGLCRAQDSVKQNGC